MTTFLFIYFTLSLYFLFSDPLARLVTYSFFVTLQIYNFDENIFFKHKQMSDKILNKSKHFFDILISMTQLRRNKRKMSIIF